MKAIEHNECGALLNKYAQEIESLRAQLAEVTRKYEESVGGFKRDIQEKLDQQRTKNKRLETKILATQAHAARLVEALEIATVGACNCLTKTHEASYHAKDCKYRIFVEALSTPINLDALREALARECERLAERTSNKFARYWLLMEADDHRASKDIK